MTTRARLGTRGSELAVAQSRLVAAMLRERAGIETELVVISTTGDREQAAPEHLARWSTGSFVGELERALLDGTVDLAVHSYKDMPTASTPGLVVAGVPRRGPPHDVLVFASPEGRDGARAALDGGAPAAGLVIGTSSPRRSAQLRRAIGCVIKPVRGNVPTRIARLLDAAPGSGLGAVCLAAAGLERLDLAVAWALELDVHRFPIAPAQGALAVQTRAASGLADVIAVIEDPVTRAAVETERAFVRTIEAGCHTAAGAFAWVEGDEIRLLAEYHADAGDVLRIDEHGTDPDVIGKAAGDRVLGWLRANR